MTQPEHSPRKLAPLARALLALLRGILIVLIVFDELLRPLYRPLVRRVATLRIMQRLEHIVAALPRPLVLLALVIPFAIAEPLKLLGLILFARGQFWAGLVVTAIAHLASFLIVERIYHAGRAQLMSYGWFAWGMGLILRLRARLLGWVRSSAVYERALRARDAARHWWRSLRA